MKKTLFLLLLLAGSVAHAFDNPPLGPRSLAMGGCGVSLKNDIWCTQNNQAGLAWVKGFHVGAMYESRFLVSGLGMKAFAAAMPTKAGTFGVNVSSLGLGNIYSENKAGICFAKPFGDKIAASVQMDLIYTHIGENYGSATSACGEFGIMAEPVKDLMIGFHIFNLTRSKLGGNTDEQIPIVMKFGGTYKFSDAVLVTLEAEKDADYKATIRAGMEYRPVNNFYLRAGAASNHDLIAFGFGLVMKNISLDVSATWHSVLGYSPALGLVY
ncbi:MAG TPA: hypothetical protein VL651_02580 [Bacteroidia bacterium]|jgi:hypothetical protein|nr:hypothetical protein [Bacteroidia bacterium]